MEQKVTECNKCPVCGSTRRVWEEAAKEARDSGRAGEDFRLALYAQQMPIASQQYLQLIPPGKEFPVMCSVLDVCADCHVVYEIVREEAMGMKKRAVQPEIKKAQIDVESLLTNRGAMRGRN